MTTEFLIRNCTGMLPEIILSLTICVLIIADMRSSLSKSREVCGTIALIGTVAALASLSITPMLGEEGCRRFFFYHTFIRDHLALVFKLIILIGGSLSVLFSLRSKEIEGFRQGEYYSLLLGAVLGACFLASAHNFVLFVLALETLSMCSYVLAGYLKQNRRSAEASLKYMLYGAVASGVMLFGLSYFYGLSGTLNISESMTSLAQQATSGRNGLVMLLAFVLVLTGLGFKIAMVPFHFWCPDVYQGAPTPVTAFLSVVSKTAGFAALLRILAPVFARQDFISFFSPEIGLSPAQLLFGLLAVVTMTFGNLVAIRETDAKRILGYSSIAHAGYLLLGLAVFQPEAVEAMLIYLSIFLFMNLGAFWVIILLVNHAGDAELSRFKGAAYHAPLLFVVLFICLVSLTGLPPTAGFVAKFMLFKVVVGAGIDAMAQGAITSTSAFYFSLALIGMLNSVVSLFYYMKIAKVMVFEQDPDAEYTVEWSDKFCAVVLAIPVIALINFGYLVDMVEGVVGPVSPIILTWLVK